MTLKVLVIDDDDVDRMAVQRGLRLVEERVQIDEAASANDAIRTLRERTYDCIFLDYLLPDGDGLDVVRRARSAGIRTPIVILTGQGDERIAVELMKAGATDYLPKSNATPQRIRHTFRTLMRLQDAESKVVRVEAERARLSALEREARADAEAAQRRLLFLAEASTALADSLDIQLTVDTIAGLAIPTLGDWGCIEVVDRNGLVRALVRRADGTLTRFARARAGRSRALPRTGGLIDPETLAFDPAFEESRLDLHEVQGPASALVAPLIARGRAIGAITLATFAPRPPFTEDDLTFALELARRAAIAVDNASLYEESREAGARLRHQLDFNRAVSNSLAEGICALDHEGRITLLNPAAEALLCVRGEEAMGRKLHEIVHAHGRGEPCPLVDTLGLGRLARSESDTFLRSDGSSFLVSYAASPIVSDARVLGTVLAFHDITDRRRAEEELEQSRRQMAMNEKLSALGTLVSGVAHELRTPLTYIANNVFLIQHRLERAAKEHPAVEPLLVDLRRFSIDAMDGVDRIRSLVRDLRPFVNPEPGARQPLPLHEVVGGAVELFRATQRGRAVVEAELHETPPIPLDKGQVQRVVINLLLNAVEAMPGGGRVRITTRPVAEGAEVEVADEGAGLAPSVQARIFDPFFTTKPEGTGLGLSITRSMVEAHGGRITFRTRLGAGTTFTVFLPSEGSSATTSSVGSAMPLRVS